jgi:hypothetical protein
VIQEIKITYNFKKLKGKPKTLLEKLGFKIKSYGVQQDAVTLVFLLGEEETNILTLLKDLGVSIKSK